MEITSPYREYVEEYDRWYDEHQAAYLSEVACVREMIPETGRGLEVGVGTGRFAAPLQIKWGVDPASGMLEKARARGVAVIRAAADRLPFSGRRFDFGLFVTSICFLPDPAAALEEAARVVRSGGSVIVGLVDRESGLGRKYEEKKGKSRFYKKATFYSVPEVLRLLASAGWGETAVRQTLFGRVDAVQSSREGYGEGGFAVVSARKI